LHFWASTIKLDFAGWPEDFTFPAEAKDPITCDLSNHDGHITGQFRVTIDIAKAMSKEKHYSAVRVARITHSVSPNDIRLRKEEGPYSTERGAARLSENPTAGSHDEQLKDPDPNIVTPLEDFDGDSDTTAELAFFPDELSNEEAYYRISFDRQRYDAYKPFCLYELLVVEWQDGIAYRIGIGEMHVDAWIQKPEAKLVLLA
jgi:hypothetical protein